MNSFPLLFSISLVSTLAAGSSERIQNERGVVGYDDTEQLPWCEYRKHDPNRPTPVHVVAEPIIMEAPSDAVILFDGTSLEAWQSSTWSIRNGILVAGDGDLSSVSAFGDCQIHLEFKVPKVASSELFNRGNSGAFPMGLYEIQIFDSHPGHPAQIYADGQCAAIYGETPPRVNACREPGAWQSYDILFTAPRFQERKLLAPARVTMLHNGVLVHLAEPVRGPMNHRIISAYEPHADKLPFKLQGHGSAVSFRNIWIRDL